MRRILTALLAGLCGVPGPVIAVVLIAIVNDYRYPWHDELVAVVLAMIRRALDAWPFFIVEAIFGFMFGLMLFFAETPPTIRRGMLLGSVSWFIIGFPFVVITIQNIWSQNDLIRILSVFGAYLVHIFGGAIAGYHVEYFLLRKRSNSTSEQH